MGVLWTQLVMSNVSGSGDPTLAQAQVSLNSMARTLKREG